jgi:hypothetical protein
VAYGDPQLLHVDSVLTNISVRYNNRELVGEQLFPAVSVEKQSNKYNVYDKTGFTVLDDLRAPGAHTNEMPPMSLSRDSYFAEEHALKDWVPIEEDSNADPGFSPLSDAAERVTNTILINREDAMQTMVRTAANYLAANTTTLSGTAQWNDYTNSQPVSDLKVGRDAIYIQTGFTPNIAILGYDVATKLEDHPRYLDRMKTTQLANNNALDAVGTLAGIPRLVRGAAIKNTAAVGQAQTFAYMWGKDVVLAYVPSNPGPNTPAFAYEFNWEFEGSRMPTDRWFDKDRKATAVRTTRRYDLKFIAVDAVATGKAVGGYLIKNAIA